MSGDEDLELRRRLAAGDPLADGCEPGPAEWAEVRARLLHACSPPTVRPSPAPARALWTWSAIAAAAVLALVVGRLIVDGGRDGGHPTAPDIVRRPAGSPVSPIAADPFAPGPPGAAHASRTVIFTAPHGTRIIWTLNPEFELPASAAGPAVTGS